MSESSLVHAVAGSVGGAAAMTVTYPFEQVRTLAQAGKFDVASIPDRYRIFGSALGPILYILAEKPEGLAFLYQGCPSVLETVAVSNFIYFFSAQYCRKLLSSQNKLSGVPLSLASSTLAAGVNILLTEPLWKANTMIKTMPKKSAKNATLISVLQDLVRKEGILSLWNGTLVSMYLISNPVIQFTLYELIKGRFTRRRGGAKNFTAKRAFIVGALSKALATLVTYPLQIAQTQVRMTGGVDGSVINVLLRLYGEGGAQALFRGCNAKMTQTVLTAAFMFSFYERIVAALLYLSKI